MNLLKWLLFPGVLRIADEGGGGGAGDNMIAEEGRKTALRKKIDSLYGYGSPSQKVKRTFNDGRVDMLDAQPEQSLGMRLVTGGLKVPDENAPAPDFKDETVTVPDDEAAAARTSMDAENTNLSNAVRAYHTDQLGREYTKAERNTRFKLARQGLLGGSEDVYQQGEVKSDRDLGATRVDDAVRRAVAGLVGQRENERLSAINLVNSGAGDSAVSSAQAGIKNSFENAASANKANLFEDLFAGSANAVAGSDAAAQQAALAARYNTRLSSFFTPRSSTSGRVTPTS